MPNTGKHSEICVKVVFVMAEYFTGHPKMKRKESMLKFQLLSDHLDTFMKGEGLS
jgi:hypothetical protein